MALCGFPTGRQTTDFMFAGWASARAFFKIFGCPSVALRILRQRAPVYGTHGKRWPGETAST